MTTATLTAIIILALLLCFWKHIAALLLDLHADYRIWKALTADGLEHRSLLRYLWERFFGIDGQFGKDVKPPTNDGEMFSHSIL